MAKKEITVKEYTRLFKNIKERIISAQYKALRAVNKELIILYWDIGKMIIEKQKGKTWGKSVVEQLAKDLQNEFPGIKGFSVSNLWRTKLFYESYHKNENLAQLVREIGWSHNIFIMEKCKDDLQREFYIRMARRHGWSRSILTNHVENKTYEKTLLSKTNFDKAISKENQIQAKLAVKDEYTFDFLELGKEHSEKELEKSLLLKIESFLKEMGGYFTFVGSQYRLEVEGNEYFIDILLYHRVLKSLVALELKIGDFKPEYVGKMQFYLAVLDDKVRVEGENPSIGIILCKNKKKIIIEYALRNSQKPIGVAEYKIVSQLPEELKGQLPSLEQIKNLLDKI
jgi:predicted nuclease of restriction endonuclease-like (RecB) superfamily